MTNVVKFPAAPRRWTATLEYRRTAGLAAADVSFDEFTELAQIIESGPDWNTLDRIEIPLTEPAMPGLTLEQAEKL